MFCGRRTELNTLNALFESGKFELAVVYGRRRVGKTMLLNEFCEGRKAIFFTGIETSVSENLSQLSQTVLEYSGGGVQLLIASKRSFYTSTHCAKRKGLFLL